MMQTTSSIATSGVVLHAWQITFMAPFSTRLEVAALLCQFGQNQIAMVQTVFRKDSTKCTLSISSYRIRCDSGIGLGNIFRYFGQICRRAESLFLFFWRECQLLANVQHHQQNLSFFVYMRQTLLWAERFELVYKLFCCKWRFCRMKYCIVCKHKTSLLFCHMAHRTECITEVTRQICT